MADDTPAAAPQPLDLTQFSKIEFIVNPSMIRPVLVTAASLIAFASATLLSVVHYLSARDFIGLWLLLQKQETLAGFAQLAAAAILIWRLIVAHLRKKKENRLVDTSSIAMRTTDPVSVQVVTSGPEPEFVNVPAGNIDLRAVAREPATAATPATATVEGSVTAIVDSVPVEQGKS